MNMQIYVYTIKQLLALDWIVFFWKNIKTFIEKVNSGCYSNLKKYLFNVFNKELLVIFLSQFLIFLYKVDYGKFERKGA